jgi:hypothetical protein
MRKVIFILALFTGTFISVNAQDIIVKRSGVEIKAKVTEINVKDVKFILDGDSSGEIKSLQKSELSKIKYEDGNVDVFNYDSNAGTKESEQVGKTYQVSRTQNQTVARNVPEQRVSSYQRRGYAGIGVGGSFLRKDYANLDDGIQFNINAGYLFGKHFGITSSFLYTSYDLTNVDDSSIGLIGGFVGPLISFSTVSQKVEFDIRPMLGYVSIHATWEGESDTADESVFAYSIGGSARWNISKLISLSGNLDYIHQGKYKDEDISLIYLHSIGFTVGVNFRF